MTEALKGRFSKFRDASVMGVRNYIPPGIHVLQARRFEMSLSKNPKNEGKEKSIIEFKIIETNHDKSRPGEIVSLVEMSTSQGYYGNVKAVTAGMLGMSIDAMEKDEDFDKYFDQIWGQNQILVGHLVRCTAQQVKTQAGGDYTAKSWEAVPARMYPEFGLIAPQGAFDDSDGSAPKIG